MAMSAKLSDVYCKLSTIRVALDFQKDSCSVLERKDSYWAWDLNSSLVRTCSRHPKPRPVPTGCGRTLLSIINHPTTDSMYLSCPVSVIRVLFSSAGNFRRLFHSSLLQLRVEYHNVCGTVGRRDFYKLFKYAARVGNCVRPDHIFYILNDNFLISSLSHGYQSDFITLHPI